jgi:NTE family protein
MNVHPTIANRRTAHKRVERRNVAPKALSLALQGSGTHGAFSWGVIDKLLEDGRLTIEAISATGGAAFNAAIYSSALVAGGNDDARERLEKFWRALSRICAPFNPIRKIPLDAVLGFAGASVPVAHRWFETVTQVLGPRELNPLNYNPFQAALEETVDVDAVCRIDAPRITIGATNVRTGQRRTFANRDVTVDVVLASSCVPTLFHAVEIDGEVYWDGGYSGGPSILPLCCGGTRDVLLSHIHPIERREVPRSASAVRDRTCEIAAGNSLAQELRMLAFAAKLVEDDWIRPERKPALGRVRLHMIRSDDVMSDLSVASRFETDWRSLTRLRDLGRQAAELWLEASFERVGICSTAQIEL